jgi:periplasmic protein TonB
MATKKRYASSFGITAIIYVALIASFLFSFDSKMAISSQAKQSTQNVKFTIVSQKPQSQPKKKVEKKVVKKINPKKLVKKVENKPEPKQTIEKFPRKKIVKKEPVKKPEPKKVEKKIVKKIEKPQQKIVKQQIKQNKTISKSKSNLEDEKRKLQEQKNIYYTMIKESIAKNKIYPKVAVRRGIQGDVKVDFTISKNGELLEFKIVEGKNIFKKSINNAIDKSFPIQLPKDLFTANLDLSITIQYRLN